SKLQTTPFSAKLFASIIAPDTKRSMAARAKFACPRDSTSRQAPSSHSPEMHQLLSSRICTSRCDVTASPSTHHQSSKRDRLMAIFNKDSKGIDDIKNLPANSNALSIIAAGTEILGDIDTREAVIGGHVQGTVNASDRVEIQGTSVIIGDINTRALAVIEGGRINGSVRIADAKEPGSDEQIH